MLDGLIVPVVTPYRDGQIDDAALAGHCRWVVDQGATGVMLFGTTGEGPSVSVAEKIAAARTLTRADPDLVVIGAVTETSWSATRECLAGYGELPLAAVLVLPPFYFREDSGDGVAAFFDAVVSASHHPVLGYHIPSMAPGVPLDYLTTGPLWGAKNSGPDPEFTRSAINAGKVMFVGNEALVAEGIAAGAAGTIAGMGNIVPSAMADICRSARDGDLAGAQRLTDAVLALQRALLRAAPGLEFIAAYKDLAGRLQGRDLGDPLPPLRRRREYPTEEVLDAVEKVGGRLPA